MNKWNTRKTGISLSYVNTVANVLITFFLSVYILRLVGKSEYGVYQSMSSFLSYLMLMEFGLGSIMVRNISMCDKDDGNNLEIQKNVSTLWNTSLILSLVMLLISVVFYTLLDTIYANSMTEEQISYGKWIFLFVAGRMILSFLAQGMKGCILGFERYGVSQIVSLTHLFARAVFATIALQIVSRVIVVVLIDLVLQAICTLFYFIYCKVQFSLSFSPKYFSPDVFRSSFPLAIALFLQTIVNTANNNVDKFVISVMLNTESVAVYSVAMFIYMTFSTLMTVPISMYMPQIARDMKEGKRGAELTATLVPACRISTLIGGLVLFGFIAIGRQFIELFYGADYMEAWIIAVLVMVPMFIHMTNSVLVNVLDILKKRLACSLCLMLTTVFNIILTVLWVKNWNMIGAAVATCICTFIGQDIILNIYYSKKIGIRVMWLFLESYKGLIPSFLPACAVSFLIAHYVPDPVWSFILGAVAFIGISALLLWLFGLNHAEKTQIRGTCRSLLRKKG